MLPVLFHYGFPWKFWLISCNGIVKLLAVGTNAGISSSYSRWHLNGKHELKNAIFTVTLYPSASSFLYLLNYIFFLSSERVQYNFHCERGTAAAAAAPIVFRLPNSYSLDFTCFSHSLYNNNSFGDVVSKTLPKNHNRECVNEKMKALWDRARAIPANEKCKYLKMRGKRAKCGSFVHDSDNRRLKKRRYLVWIKSQSDLLTFKQSLRRFVLMYW